MKELGETAFGGNYAYFNFEKNTAVAEVFAYDLDPHRILRELSALHGKAIVPGETLLIFDEIQSCVSAITSLKYFCEDLPELHVIGAGSLLGVTLNSVQLSFPVGKVNRMQMYPMSFQEFLEATNPNAVQWLECRWKCTEPLEDAFTIPFANALKLYYIVGGMPKAVETWQKTSDLEKVEQVQDDILRDYANDFAKHAPISEQPKLSLIWDSIPQQLAKENHKFIFSHVKKGARAADLENALSWLEDAGLVYKVHLTEQMRLPLAYQADATHFKVYMADVGLLRRKAGVTAQIIMQGNGTYGEFKGALTENFVLQQLLSLNKKPYFWRSNNQAEVDFVFEEDGNFIPVEVKSDENTKAKSYARFCELYQPSFGFVTSLKNVGDHKNSNTQTYSVPLYLLWKLNDWIQLERAKAPAFDLNAYMNESLSFQDLMK